MASTNALALESFRRWREDPCLFANQAVMLNKTKGKFTLRDYQEDAFRLFLTERKLVVLKARQIGYTTITSIYSLWFSMFHPDSVTVILSRKQDLAKESLEKIRRSYHCLPRWLREQIKIVGNAKERIEFSNGSVIHAESSAEAARGYSANLLLADEFAFMDDGARAWAAIEPVFEEDGQIIIFSTPNGVGNIFHTIYSQAKAGTNGFTPLFLPWSVHPNRDQAWYDEKMRAMEEWQLHQEYPSDDLECFLRSGRSVFKREILAVMSEYVEAPETFTIVCNTLSGRGHLEPWGDDGSTRVYRDQIAFDADLGRGHVYVAGVDVALGTDNGDYSVVQIFDADLLEQVAVYESRESPEDFAPQIVVLMKEYGDPLLGIERNNHGASVINLVHGYGYRNLYGKRRKRVHGRKPHERFGWSTTPATKPRMIDDLSASLDDLIIHDERTLTQLESYNKRVTGSRVVYEGLPHDDLVIGCSIAVQMMAVRRLPVAEEVEQRPEGLTYNDILPSLEPRRRGWGSRRSKVS